MGRVASSCRGRGEHARRAWLAVTVVLAAALPRAAAALPVQVSVDRVTLGQVTATGVRADLDGAGLTVQAQRVELADDWQVDDVEIACAVPASGAMPCAHADWKLALVTPGSDAQTAVHGAVRELSQSPAGWAVETALTLGPIDASLRVETGGGDLEARLEWNGQPLARISALPLLPSPAQWITDGRSSGWLALTQQGDAPLSGEYSLTASDLTFDSPEGRYAAAGLTAGVRGSVVVGQQPELTAKASLSGGELLLGNFYAAFDTAPLALTVRATRTADRLVLHEVTVGDGGAVRAQASAQLDLDRPLASLVYRIDRLELHFPLAYARYLETLLAPLALDGLTVTGDVLWHGADASEARRGGFPEGELQLQDLSVVDNRRRRFAVTGLDADLSFGGGPADSTLSWRGLLLQRINLGAGQARIDTRPGAFALAEPLRLGVLGGVLSLDRLDVQFPGQGAAGAEPHINLQASLRDMEMALLTDALDWPRFEGRISGTIPGVSLEAGVLSVDGKIVFDVFDGRLQLTGLRVERPFGVLPSLAADIDVDGIDLERLTQTFSFGRISGRLDGYMHDLRMLDWKPVAFDAWFGTPADQSGKQDISRQAVNHLTSIGGGGPTAALSGPLLRLFNDFSYRRLGMGCELHDNVCRIRGLEDDQNSVLILEGAGIPKIMIRAYNRRMDFPQLVANLTAATHGEGVRIGNGP